MKRYDENYISLELKRCRYAQIVQQVFLGGIFNCLKQHKTLWLVYEGKLENSNIKLEFFENSNF